MTGQPDEFDELGVTSGNNPMILYFDPGRSRLFEGEDAVYYLPGLRDREFALFWCAANGVAFYDHRIERYPLWLRAMLLRSRSAGAVQMRKKRLRWLPVTFPPDEAWEVDVGNRVPSRSEAKAQAVVMSGPKNPRASVVSFWMSDDDDVLRPYNSKGQLLTDVDEEPPL